MQIEDTLEVALPPWEASPSGVVSLYDMLKFRADELTVITGILNACEIRLIEEDRYSKAPKDAIQKIKDTVELLQIRFSEYGLISTIQQARRILDRFADDDDVSNGELRDLLGNLRLRLRDDQESHFFLHLSMVQGEQYQNPLKGWDSIFERFSKVRYNIEESNKCFALERYGAAVFHILLVAEYGVIEVAKLIGVADPHKPGWNDLDDIERVTKKKWNDRTALEQQHANLIEEFLPLALAVKNSWRHKISHVDKQIVWEDTDFGTEVASEIISATKGFMRKLAKDLP
jgi:hypothetical protein